MDSRVDLRQNRLSCLRLLLRPLVSFCLRQSLTVQDLIEELKTVFVEESATHIDQAGGKVNVSKISVMTGLHRRDVMRLHHEGRKKDSAGSFASRVIGQWVNDSRFLTKGRKPRDLSVEGEHSEFRQLVSLVSTDFHAGTVLFELERHGLVERKGNSVRLLRRIYVPKKNPIEGFQLVSKDWEDLLFAVERNVFHDLDTPNLHARTEFDNIFINELPMIRKWLLQEGSKFHRKVRSYLSRFDKDINPNPKHEGGGRVSFGSFSRIEGDKE